jgi:hypothetical protein
MSVPLDYFTEKKGIENFSDPKVVQRKAKLHGIDVVYSPLKNKKFRFVNPETNKYVDFGFFKMQDFTKHEDEERRKKFKQRNRRFKDAPKYSASWASYYILW